MTWWITSATSYPNSWSTASLSGSRQNLTIDRVAAGDVHSDTDNESLLQVDFSVNYTCVFQDEVQSAHWQHAQISLFTAALWYEGTLHPIVLTSDNLTHSKGAMVAYIDRLLEEIPETVKKVSIWSDCPASWFMVAALKPLQEKNSIEITWNFFATSHGKGPVDGIGGAVKHVVWNSVRSRKNIVNNASIFTKADSASHVKVIEVKPCEIDEINKALGIEQMFNQAGQIQGIARVHYVAYKNEKQSTSDADSNEWDDNVSKHSVGGWCVVEYQGNMYPGEVKKIVCGEYQVPIMVPTGNNWKWPVMPDEIFYTADKLSKRLKPPFIVNNREHFGILDL